MKPVINIDWKEKAIELEALVGLREAAREGFRLHEEEVRP